MSDSDSVIFLFQGIFHPERQLGKLIEDWPQTDERALLWLRGPHWSYREELIELARSTGLLGKRIFFPEPVSEAQLVAAAAEAHVGIIPYDPSVHVGYKFACPNKLSQYLAAGLTILTTDLEYVERVVVENKLGRVFSLHESGSLVRQVNELTRDRRLRATCAVASRSFFLREFNWEVVSQPLYDRISAKAIENSKRVAMPRAQLRFDWTTQVGAGALATSMQSLLALMQRLLSESLLARRAWRSLPTPVRRFLLNHVLRQLTRSGHYL